MRASECPRPRCRSLCAWVVCATVSQLPRRFYDRHAKNWEQASWVNKDQKRPACLGIMSSPATHYWAACLEQVRQESRAQVVSRQAHPHHRRPGPVRKSPVDWTSRRYRKCIILVRRTKPHSYLCARVSRQEKAAFDLFVWDAHAATKLAAAQGLDRLRMRVHWSSDGLYIAVACSGRCEIYSVKPCSRKHSSWMAIQQRAASRPRIIMETTSSWSAPLVIISRPSPLRTRTRRRPLKVHIPKKSTTCTGPAASWHGLRRWDVVLFDEKSGGRGSATSRRTMTFVKVSD